LIGAVVGGVAAGLAVVGGLVAFLIGWQRRTAVPAQTSNHQYDKAPNIYDEVQLKPAAQYAVGRID